MIAEVPEKMFKDCGTQTITQKSQVPQDMLVENFSIEDLKYYTGFDTKRFKLLFCAIDVKYSPFDKYIDTKNQLAMCLMKYRRAIDFFFIAKLYKFPRKVVSNIFSYWTRLIYLYLNKIDFWSLRYKQNSKYTAIIDCSEIYTERSSINPKINQETFSNYKNHNTFKYLIAIDEKGLVIFCSAVYGGSKSDRFIVENSNFIELLSAGDILLADRGFNISDLLETKGVALNIPPFKSAPQFEINEIMETRIIANRRIHVERVIN